MRINVVFEGVLVAAKENSSADGQRKFHNLSIESNDEAGTFNCSDAVYEGVVSGTFSKYKSYRFECVYNSDYKSFSVQRILPLK